MKTIRFLSVGSALFLLAASQSLAQPVIPKVSAPITLPFGKDLGNNVKFPPVFVNANGTIVVSAVLKTNGDASVDMKVELLKPDGSAAVPTPPFKQKGASPAGATTSLTYKMLPGEENMLTRMWIVKVTNTDTKNHFAGQATVVINYPTLPGPVNVTVNPSAATTIPAGLSADKTFTVAKAGKITIEATWDTDFNVNNPNGPLPLRIKLFKPGVDPDTGPTVRTASARSKFTMTYNATSADVSAGSKWAMNIINSNSTGISNLKVTVSFLVDRPTQ